MLLWLDRELRALIESPAGYSRPLRIFLTLMIRIRDQEKESLLKDVSGSPLRGSLTHRGQNKLELLQVS